MNWLLGRLVDALIARAKRTPYFHLQGYMNRWWLLPYASWRPAVRIHEILRSDDDRAFHDHPWPYLSVILRGGYFEVRPTYDKSGLFTGETRKWYGPGSVIFRRAKAWHRLEVPAGTVATTLFITGRMSQKWGFQTSPVTKVYYRDYLKEFSS